MHDMKTSALTIRLDSKLVRAVARIARRTGRSRSEVIRDAVRRQLALARFQDLRRRIMPLAEARGYLTDEDVFRNVSSRIALDTNVLVSAVATRGLCADVLNLVLAEHELVIGETVLAETARVLRDKMRVPKDVIQEFVELLRDESEVVQATEPLQIVIRDQSNVAVMSEAISGRAEVLVTGDRDLLEISAPLPIKVITPRGLWDVLRVGGDERSGV